MKVSWLEPAEDELDDAFSQYESVQEGLGYRFLSEVELSISRIIDFPKSYQGIGKYSKRCLVHKFPYGLIYQHIESENEILMIAVAHLHRRPDFWLSREEQ